MAKQALWFCKVCMRHHTSYVHHRDVDGTPFRGKPIGNTRGQWLMTPKEKLSEGDWIWCKAHDEQGSMKFSEEQYIPLEKMKVPMLKFRDYGEGIYFNPRPRLPDYLRSDVPSQAPAPLSPAKTKYEPKPALPGTRMVTGKIIIHSRVFYWPKDGERPERSKPAYVGFLFDEFGSYSVTKLNYEWDVVSPGSEMFHANQFEEALACYERTSRLL